MTSNFLEWSQRHLENSAVCEHADEVMSTVEKHSGTSQGVAALVG